MHKRRLNELWIDLTIRPNGPLLIKSGLDSAADPTLPQMSFVRTLHPATGGDTVYLPGSSVKGVIRSHSERIIRSALAAAERCCDPLRNSCARRLNNLSESAEIYRRSCLACRLFGSTAVGSHFFINDAYPDTAIHQLTTRHNVAIDRRTGAASGGSLFDLEVLSSGAFRTTLHIVNFELWQLGLIALTLRDIDEGRVRIGFAKSRGFGAVNVTQEKLTIRYYGQFGGHGYDFAKRLYGVGGLVRDDVATSYGYQSGDTQEATGAALTDGGWGQIELSAGGSIIRDLQTAGVHAWAALLDAESEAST